MRLFPIMMSLITVFSVATAMADVDVQIENCQQTTMEVDQELPYLYLFEVRDADQQDNILAAIGQMSTLKLMSTKHFKALKLQSMTLAPQLDATGIPYTDAAIQAEVRGMIQANPLMAEVIYSCNHIMHAAPKAGGAN